MCGSHFQLLTKSTHWLKPINVLCCTLCKIVHNDFTKQHYDCKRESISPCHTALFQTLHMFLCQWMKFLVEDQTNGFLYPPAKLIKKKKRFLMTYYSLSMHNLWEESHRFELQVRSQSWCEHHSYQQYLNNEWRPKKFWPEHKHGYYKRKQC